MSFGDLLRSWMARQHYIGKDAAGVLGVSESTIGRWLKGTGVPDIRRVDELARAFDLPSTEVALAIVAGATADPMVRVEQLLEAVLARLDGVETRQLELEARLGEIAP